VKVQFSFCENVTHSHLRDRSSLGAECVMWNPSQSRLAGVSVRGKGRGGHKVVDIDRRKAGPADERN
jgi:hypothetical protein